ncbi:MAG: hypothetical protein HRF50_16540, partial [Phycisphaerae bacterium]
MTPTLDQPNASQVAAQPSAGAARDLLTSTRLATLRRCQRQHYYRYE